MVGNGSDLTAWSGRAGFSINNPISCIHSMVSLRSFFLILLLCLAGAWLPAPLQAARIPILRDTVKQRVTPTSGQDRRAGTATAGWITLGRPHNISAVKLQARSFRRSGPSSTGVARRISSRSVIIIDAKTGETIFAKAPDQPRQPASTIKVLTGLIAMKSLKDTDTVEVSRHASRMPRSKIYLDTRKQYKADDLINAVLLASANDASVALAEKIAGSEPDFAEMMTLRARLWGARNTVCRTATGLTARGQHSTARDLATIFRRAMQDEEFASRVRQVKVRTSFGKVLRNHNKALWRLKGAVGGKTGYTAAARQTYVGQFSRNGDSIIVAIMGSETMWDDLRTLVEYGFRRKQQIRLARLEKSGDNRQVARVN